MNDFVTTLIARILGNVFTRVTPFIKAVFTTADGVITSTTIKPVRATHAQQGVRSLATIHVFRYGTASNGVTENGAHVINLTHCRAILLELGELLDTNMNNLIIKFNDLHVSQGILTLTIRIGIRNRQGHHPVNQ